MGKYAIIITLGLFITLSYFILSTNKTRELAMSHSVEYISRKHAQNVATSHTAIALQKLHNYNIQAGFDSTQFNYSRTLQRPKGAQIKVKVEPTANFGEFKITSRAKYRGLTTTTVVFDQQIPFSYYAWFLNSWPSSYLGTGEGVTGPFHSNSYIHIGQVPGPTLSGNTTCVNGVKWYSGATASNFRGFLGDNNNFNHPAIQLPTDIMSNIDKTKTVKLDTIIAGTDDLYLEFDDNSSGEGVMKIWKNVSQLDPRRNRAGHATEAAYQAFLAANYVELVIDDLAFDIVYSVNHNIHVEGCLNGTVSLATEKKFIVDDDVTLKDDPRVNPDSEMMLGLYSTQGMIISSKKIPNSANSYYNADGCFIMANIFTPSTITIENLSSWQGPKNRGEFRVYGSRTQQQPTATWSGGSPYSGFKEFIEYDTRFRKLSPPGVPMTKNRKITRWNETF